MWSSVTVRLRNSHSAYLHTPGVTTRKPLPAVIQIPGLCRVLGRTSLFTLPMVPVLFNTTLPWEQSVRYYFDYCYNYEHMIPL